MKDPPGRSAAVCSNLWSAKSRLVSFLYLQGHTDVFKEGHKKYPYE